MAGGSNLPQCQFCTAPRDTPKSLAMSANVSFALRLVMYRLNCSTVSAFAIMSKSYARK